MNQERKLVIFEGLQAMLDYEVEKLNQYIPEDDEIGVQICEKHIGWIDKLYILHCSPFISAEGKLSLCERFVEAQQKIDAYIAKSVERASTQRKQEAIC